MFPSRLNSLGVTKSGGVRQHDRVEARVGEVGEVGGGRRHGQRGEVSDLGGRVGASIPGGRQRCGQRVVNFGKTEESLLNNAEGVLYGKKGSRGKGDAEASVTE
jgi:hypothetical protein